MLSEPMPFSVVLITVVVLAVMIAVGIYFVNKFKERV